MMQPLFAARLETPWLFARAGVASGGADRLTIAGYAETHAFAVVGALGHACGLPAYAYPNPYTSANADAYCSTRQDANTHVNVHSYPHSNPNAYSYVHAYSRADADSCCLACPYCHCSKAHLYYTLTPYSNACSDAFDPVANSHASSPWPHARGACLPQPATDGPDDQPRSRRRR
jgi:hypothetical protein